MRLLRLCLPKTIAPAGYTVSFFCWLTNTLVLYKTKMSFISAAKTV
jgi:hypothetical protein